MRGQVMKKLFFLFLAVVVLSSCSSLSRTDNNAPSWIEDPPTPVLSTVFVGSGEGESREDARTNAVLNVIDKMGEMIDIDYREKYFSELYSSSSISDLSTSISDEYTAVDENGLWHCYILTVSNTARLNEVLNRDYSQKIERENRLTAKVNESLSYYRNNEDVSAVNALLEAVEISLEGEVSDEDYSTDVLVARIEKYLSQISFTSVDDRKKTGGLPGFRIYRNKGILHPAVENASLRVFYPSLAPDGNVIYLAYSALSDENGIVIVNKTNAYTLKKGTMSITIGIDEDILSRIEKKGGEELLSGVRAILDELHYSSEYSEAETYQSGEALIALALAGYDGARVDITEGRKIIEDMALKLGLENVVVVEAEGEDEDEALDFLNENYSQTDVIYLIRIGIVDRLRTLDSWYTKTEGKIIRIDNRTGTEEEYLTMQYSTLNEGDTPMDGKAFENQIRLTCGLVLGEY